MLKSLLLLFILLPFVSTAQVPTVNISGTERYVYPFSAPQPYVSNTSSWANYHEDLQDGKRVVVKTTFTRQASAWERSQILNKKARKKLKPFLTEVPWIMYDQFDLIEQSIPPSPDSLPDGEYVQYYKALPYVDGDTVKYRFDYVAALFTLRDNVPEGAYVFLAPSGDTLQEGTFRNGLLHGDCQLREYRYIPVYAFMKQKVLEERLRQLHSGEGRYLSKQVRVQFADNQLTGNRDEAWFDDESRESYRKTARYEQDRLNGPFLETSYGAPLKKGEYTKGTPSGEWFEYALNDRNDLMSGTWLQRHYIYPRERKTGHGVIVRERFFESSNDTMMHGGFGLKLYDPELTPLVDKFAVSFDYFYDVPQPDTFILLYPYSLYIEKTGLQRNSVYIGQSRRLATRQEAIDSLGYDFVYAFYEEFYPNGQRMLRLRVNDGQLESEDTVFWSNGQAANIVTYDTITQQYHEQQFDRNGKLTLHDVFDSKGKPISNLVKGDGPPAEIRIDGRALQRDADGLYHYRFPYNLEAFPAGLVVLSEVRRPDSSVVGQSTFDPETHVLIIESRCALGITRAEGTVDSSGMIFTGRYTFTMGGFSHSGAVMNDQRSYQRAKHLPDRVSMLAVNYLSCDSIGGLNYQGVPFSGEIAVFHNADSSRYELKKGKLTVFLAKDDFNSTYFFNRMTHYATTISGNSGTTAEAPGKVNGFYLDGLPHGKWKSRFATGAVSGISTYDRGIYDGISETWGISVPKDDNPWASSWAHDTFPTRETYYAKDRTIYEQGRTISAVSRDWTGRIVSSADYGKGTYFSRQGNDIIRSVQEGDSIIVTITRESGKQEQLIRRTASHVYPVYEPVPRDEDAASMAVQAEPSEPYRADDKELYRSNSVYEHRKTDSNNRIIFYETYEENGDLLERILWKEGLPVAFELWDNGSLKRRFDFYPEDSITFLQLSSIRQDRNAFRQATPLIWRRPLYPAKEFKRALLSNYDPRGTLRSQGDVIRLEKKGEWKYYDADGLLTSTVFYEDTLELLIDTTRLTAKAVSPQITEENIRMASEVVDAFGERVLYDVNGDAIARQWIFELEKGYNCTQDEYYETRNYYTVWERDTTLHLRNGMVRNRDENGVLQSEGPVLEGLPHGFWKFYNADGTVKEAGIYHKGLRNGRWLSGDLSKINYLGDLCLDPDEAHSRERLQSLKETLDFRVTIYRMGSKVTEQFYNVDTGQ